MTQTTDTLRHNIDQTLAELNALSHQLEQLQLALQETNIQNHPYLQSQGIALYGESAEEILQKVHPTIVQNRHAIASYFYQHMDAKGQKIISFLTPSEQEHLLTKQMEYLEHITQPQLTQESHQQMAEMAGERHDMVSLSANSLINSYQNYETAIATYLPKLNSKYLLAKLIIQQRLAQDMAWQLSSYLQTAEKRKVILNSLAKTLESAQTREDIEQASLEHILQIRGINGASFAHIDYQNHFQIEAQQGEHLFCPTEVLSLDTQSEKDAALIHAWHLRKSILCHSQQDIKQTVPSLIQAHLPDHIRSLAIYPLDETPEGTLTFLMICSPWPGFFYGRNKALLLDHLTQLIKTRLTQSSQVIDIKNLKVLNQKEKLHIKNLLAQKNIEMVYQPIVSNENGRIIKVEALARLKNNHGELISPWGFLAAFGSRDLQALYEQGLQQVCELLQTLKSKGYPQITANLNLPPELFYQKDLIQNTLALLKACDITPQQITLEVLESSISDAEFAAQIIQQFADQGFKIVLDDVGSESSSMVRMKELNIDGIKIDQEFIRPLFSRLENLHYILPLINLAESLGILCTIEGVETPALCRALSTLGNVQLQGYGIAKPLTQSQLFDWIDQNLAETEQRFCCDRDSEFSNTQEWICNWFIQLYHRNQLVSNAIPNFLDNLNLELFLQDIQQDYQQTLAKHHIQDEQLEQFYQDYVTTLQQLIPHQGKPKTPCVVTHPEIIAVKRHLNQLLKQLQKHIEARAQSNQI